MLTGQLSIYTQSSTVEFYVDIKEAPYYHISENSPPRFINGISERYVLYKSDNQQNQQIDLGPIEDVEDDYFTVTFDDNQNSFVSFIDSDVEVILEVDILAASIGNYTVYVELKDFNQTDMKSNQTYAINIEIKAKNTPPQFVNDITSLLNVQLLQTEEDQKISLGQVSDDQNNKIEVIFDD